jgi:nucleotide-binding universal stress UspA family protein
MTTTHQQGPPAGAVVAGISGEACEAALTFAADEACRTHRPLHVVHVLRLSGAEAYAGLLQGAVESAELALAGGLSRARELVNGEVPVTAELIDDGWLVADLVDRASRGAMLVLQHRRLSPARRLMTGSTVAIVASRCPVPVVSVPEDWRPGTSEAVVTVGVQDVDEAQSLISRALLEARTRRASVVVLHAWYLEGGYDPLVADREYRAEREQKVTLELAPALDMARAEFPDVPVRLWVRHALPAGALIESGASSQLLVIGRRHHLLPPGSHLGPVARAVLQDSTGPVLLNPESPRKAPIAVDATATRLLGVQPA